jgi:hypothetical protein
MSSGISHSDRAGSGYSIEAAQRNLGPVFDGLVRGALGIGILGIGVGGTIAQSLKVPFDAGFQWGAALTGAVVGALVGIRWGLRHRL